MCFKSGWICGWKGDWSLPSCHSWSSCPPGQWPGCPAVQQPRYRPSHWVYTHVEKATQVNSWVSMAGWIRPIRLIDWQDREGTKEDQEKGQGATGLYGGICWIKWRWTDTDHTFTTWFIGREKRQIHLYFLQWQWLCQHHPFEEKGVAGWQ